MAENIRYITRDGDEVERDNPEAAFQIAANDPDGDKFIQQVKSSAIRRKEIEEAEESGLIEKEDSFHEVPPGDNQSKPNVVPSSGADQTSPPTLTTTATGQQDQLHAQTIEEAFGDRPANALHGAGYHTVDAVLALSNEQLDAIEGVGKGTLEKAEKLRAERV